MIELLALVHRLAAVAGRLVRAASQQQQLRVAGLTPEDDTNVIRGIDRLVERAVRPMPERTKHPEPRPNEHRREQDGEPETHTARIRKAIAN